MIFYLMLVCGPGNKFPPGAFDAQIGTDVTVMTPHGNVVGRVVSAEIKGDGGLCEMAVEVDPATIPTDIPPADPRPAVAHLNGGGNKP